MRILGLFFVAAYVSVAFAQSNFAVDSGECQGTAVAGKTVLKTPVRSDTAGKLKTYGRLEFNNYEDGSGQTHCHVVYELFFSKGTRPFKKVHRLEWETEPGEIAGIDLIGFSPDGTKTAANYWLAQGDWVENRAVIYDVPSGKAIFRSLEDKLYRLLDRRCDGSYWENVESVTNEGKILISVPRESDCIDGGLWEFDPKTGTLGLLKKNSGRKPIE